MVATEEQALAEIAKYQAQGKRTEGPIRIVYNGRTVWQFAVEV